MAIQFNARQGLSVGPSATVVIDTSSNATVANLSATGTLFGSALVASQDTGRFNTDGIRLRSSNLNSTTGLVLMPNGTSQTTAFRLYNKDDTNGVNLGFVEFNVAGSIANIVGGSFGTGLVVGTLNIGLNTSVTGTLSATSFSGPLTGNVTGTVSGSAGSVAAANITGTTLSSNVTASSLTSFGANIVLGTPASGTLTNCTFPTLNQNTTGTATNATNAVNVGITDDTTTNGTMYPSWVTTTAGNLPHKTSSTKLSFNPSTGALTVSGAVATGTLSTSGLATLASLTVTGNLTVNGTTSTVNSATLDVADINISIGKVTTPTDITAVGGGITLLGTTNKTITWNSAANGWEFSENIQLASGKTFRINGADILSSTTLATSVVNSSLTAVGTIGTGTWQGAVVLGQYGGTGIANTGKTITLGGNLTTSGAFATTLTATNTTNITLPTTGTLATLAGAEALTSKTYNALSLTANATGFTVSGGTTVVAATFAGGAAYTISGTNGTTITLPSSTGTLPLNNQTMYVGTTAVAINRSSASLALTGISSIDGNAATATTSGTVTTAAQTNITSVGTLTLLNVAGDITMSGTGAIKVPVGTQANRPTPAQGQLRYVTDGTPGFEGYNGTTWGSIGGGTTISDITTAGTYYPTFAAATSGTMTIANVTSTKLTYNPSTGDLSSINFVSTSDRSVKENITPIENATAIVSELNGYRFNFIDQPNKLNIGLIAQEVEKVLPEVIGINLDTNLKNVNYPAIVAVLIESIKELNSRIIELEKRCL